jgi:hypothetical protein
MYYSCQIYKVGVGATIYARDRKLIKNTIYTMVAAID